MKDSKSFPMTFLKKEQVGVNVWNFYFQKPAGFKYIAGQYIKIKLPIKNPDNRGVLRYFTLSSSPTEEYLRITTHILKSTFKMTLSELQKGDKLETRGPWGDFILDETDKTPRVFLSGGIGLTPFRSMLKYATDMRLDLKIILFMSYKTEKDVLFTEEFEQMTRDNPHIEIISTITNPSKNWNGNTGRISTEFLHKHLATLANNLYYIAGPDPMIEGIRKMLLGENVPQERILTDGFPGYKINE